MKKQTTLLTVTTAMFVALGILFPQIFHFLPNGGTLFSPMHLPVLMAGLICGPLMGALTGLLSPVLSGLIFGMPPFPMPLLPMTAELIAYGALSGAFMSVFTRLNKTRKIPYIPALILAMAGGRIVFVAARVAFLVAVMPSMEFGAVLAESLLNAFVNTWAGAVLQIAFIPLCMLALQRGGVLDKYPFARKYTGEPDM